MINQLFTSSVVCTLNLTTIRISRHEFVKEHLGVNAPSLTKLTLKDVSNFLEARAKYESQVQKRKQWIS